MSALDASLALIYVVVFVARLWALRGAWSAPLFYGERHFIDVPVPDGFYQDRGRALLRSYRMVVLAPYVVEVGCFLFLLAAGKLNHLMVLMLAGGLVGAAITLIAGRVFRRKASRFAVHQEETVAPRIALALETRSLASYTNAAVEAGLAVGNLVPLILLVVWHRNQGESVWHTFRLPFLLIYAQIGFLLIKQALVGWRTTMPAHRAEAYLEFREQTRKWFMEICDWMRAQSVAFLASYAGFVLVGAGQKEIAVRWAILTPWITLAVVMIVRIINTSKRFRTYGCSLEPLRMPSTLSRSRGFLYYNPDDPGFLARTPVWFTVNFANRNLYVYLSYAVGLIVFVAAAARH